MTRRLGHTDWCARGHQCGIGEHRSDPLLVDLPGYGRAVLTRVQAGDGRQHAEIRVRVALSVTEPTARRQLACLLADLRHLVTRTAALGRTRRAA